MVSIDDLPLTSLLRRVHDRITRRTKADGRGLLLQAADRIEELAQRADLFDNACKRQTERAETAERELSACKKELAEANRKLRDHEKAATDMYEALNRGDGSYRP